MDSSRTHVLLRSANVIRALMVRDIRARYRRSTLGWLWAFLTPFMLMVVFTALSGVLEVSSGDIPYIIFSYSVVMPWTFFSSSVSRAIPSILSNASIIKKIRLPHEIFPLVGIFTAAFDTVIASVIMIGLMIWYKVAVGWALLWVLPLFLLTAALALGVGMLFASIGVFRRDILQASGFLLQLWLYLTPVIYPTEQVPEQWLPLYRLNPMVGILEGFRSVLAQGLAPDLTLLLWGLPGIGLLLLLGWLLFRYTARYFVDVL